MGLRVLYSVLRIKSTGQLVPTSDPTFDPNRAVHNRYNKIHPFLQIVAQTLIILVPLVSPHSTPSLMADLYPTYGRQYQRQEQSQYQLAPGSSSSGIMYAPQLLTQPAIVDDNQSQSPTQHEASSQSPASQQNASPKQDSPISSKPDGGMPQQPTKPQATFLTKLYACVQILRVRGAANPSLQLARAAGKPPHDSLGPCRRAHHRRAT